MSEFADYCSIFSLIISGATLIVSLRVKASIQDAKKSMYLNSQIDEYMERVIDLKDALYKAYTRKDLQQVKEKASQIKSLVIVIDKIKCKSFKSNLIIYIKSSDTIIQGNYVQNRTPKSIFNWFNKPNEFTINDVLDFYSLICELYDLLKYEKSQL